MQKSSEKREQSLDISSISDAVVNLYAAHINSLIYPYDHPLIRDFLKNAFYCLQKVLKRKSLIVLEAREGRLTVDGEPLRGYDDVLRNFASWLNGMNIQSLSIDNGITRRELGAFHKIISQNPDTQERAMAMSEMNITSIVVHPAELPFGDSVEATDPPGGPSTFQVIDSDVGNVLCKDYFSTSSHMNINEEHTCQCSDPLSWPAPEESFRERTPARCVDMLLQGDLADNERSFIQDIPPIAMADILNTMLPFAPSPDILARIAEVYFGGRKGEAAKPSANRYMTFFERLKPDLRHTMKPIVDSLFAAESTGADTGRRQQKVLDVPLAQKDTPVARRTSTGPQRTLEKCEFVFDFVARGKAVVHDIELDEKSAALFFQEHIAAPLDVSSVSKIPATASKTNGGSASLARLIEECAEQVILTTAFDDTLELLESRALESDLYQKLFTRVTAMVGFFTKHGEFGRVLDVLNALKTQSLQGRHGVHAASMIRGIFSSDQFNSDMAEALMLYGRTHRESAVKLTYALRANLVPYLLEALSEERDTTKRKFLITLLTSMKGDVLQHIVKRLRDSRWYVQRNMLYLLRECNGRSYASTVADFLHHDVPLVRLEALRALLSFQHPDAASHVRELLQSDNLQLQSGAIRLAGSYRIKAAVPSLLKLLEEKDLLGKKFSFKKTIIRALGRIGDGSAVSHLLSLCRSTSIVHRNDVDGLKVEIFRTLQNYPVSAVEPLLDYGIRSRNGEVAAISRKQMKRYGRPDVGRK